MDGSLADASDEVHLTLRRSAELQVQVVGRDGLPVPGAGLLVRPSQGPGATGVTDGAGRWLIGELAPGLARVWKLADGSLPEERGQPIELEAGARAEVVVEETGTLVRGRLLHEGRPTPGRVRLGQFHAFDPGPMSPAWELRDLPPGRNLVTVEVAALTADGRPRSDRFGQSRREIMVPPGLAELELDLEVNPRVDEEPPEAEPREPVVLNGLIRDEDSGEGVPLAVRAWFPHPLLAPADAEGCFRIALSPGRHELRVALPQDGSWWFGETADGRSRTRSAGPSLRPTSRPRAE